MNTRVILAEHEEKPSEEDLGHDASAATEATGSEIREYDFQARDHIVRGPLPALESVAERLSRRFQRTLTRLSSGEVEVHHSGITDRRLSAYASELPSVCSIHIVQLDPLPSVALMILPGTLVSLLVDGYFGGRVRVTDDAPEPREERALSAAERQVADKAVQALLVDLVDAWSIVIDLDGSCVDREMNARFVTRVSSSENLAVLRFRIDVDGVTSELSLVHPQSQLEPIRGMLSGSNGIGEQSPECHWYSSLQEHLLGARLDVRAPLVSTEMSLGQILRFTPGDVLDVDIPDSIELQIEGESLFRGAFVEHKGHNAVRIDHTYAQITGRHG